MLAKFLLLTGRSQSLGVATPALLGKKSTALEVLETLKNSNRLASYVNIKCDDDDKNVRPIAIVTGGSSGIGIPSIEALALANMNVVLCARNLQAAEEAVRSLPTSLQSNVRIQKLDLSDMSSIEMAAKEIIETEGNIDVLLNNAGVMATPKREATAQNLELQFGTNHVGHHMLTRLLLPNINTEGRIVTVASAAHGMGKCDFQNLNYDTIEGREERRYSAWGAYGQSKLSNILFAKGLSDKLKEAGSDIKTVSLHPGVIGTNLWRHIPKYIRPVVNTLMTDKNVEQGAATNVYCCLVNSSELEGGEYLTDCCITEPKENGTDDTGTLRKKLWTATEDMIQGKGFALPENLLG